MKQLFSLDKALIFVDTSRTFWRICLDFFDLGQV